MIHNTIQCFFLLYLKCVSRCLYGVFEPHNGVEAAKILLQRMAAEILFQNLTPNTTDEEIRDMLRSVHYKGRYLFTLMILTDYLYSRQP